MRAARLVEPGRFEVLHIDPPRPNPGEILVQVQGCGLCASNLGPWQGIQGILYPMDPGAPGHEVYGTVAAVGEGVDRYRPGAVVTAISYNGYAEFDVAREDAVVPVPEAIAGMPILGEPIACAVNVHRRARVRPADTVVIVGAGFLGALLVRLVRRDEPARVVAVSRRSGSLEMAERMGADEVLRYEDDVVGRIHALTEGRMADVVIEATGRQAPLDLAGELTRIRGRLIIAGYHQDGPRSINLQQWNWRGIDVVNAHERDPAIYRRGMEEGIRMIAEGDLQAERLVSHVFPLPEINRAFEMASARPQGFFKAVVAPGAGR